MYARPKKSSVGNNSNMCNTCIKVGYSLTIAPSILLDMSDSCDFLCKCYNIGNHMQAIRNVCVCVCDDIFKN